MAAKKKSASAPDAGPETIYSVRKNLRHHGKGYAPGSTVSLSDAHAAPLLKSKVVTLAPEQPLEEETEEQ
jgi:hypothetical protein